MKYIFVAGAPGSKWSSVVKNIYYSSSIDRTDYSDARTYYHDAADTGTPDLMHIGAYFDPGMEFDLPESMSILTRKQAEEIFNKPFSGTGVRIIKSHIFSYYENIQYLKELWPESPIVLVHRSNDSCLGWWVKCGHFNITYPSYQKYYRDLAHMAALIKRQNQGLIQSWHTYSGTEPQTNRLLAARLNIECPPLEYIQDYHMNDIKVKVI